MAGIGPNWVAKYLTPTFIRLFLSCHLPRLLVRAVTMDPLENINGDAMDVDQPPSSASGPHVQEQRNDSDSQVSQAGPSRPPLAASSRRASSLPLHMPVYSVGCVYSVDMMMHFKKIRDDDQHPEQPARIARIQGLLVQNGLYDKMKHIPIRQVKKHEAMLVHSEDHWDKVIQIQCEPRAYIIVRNTRIDTRRCALNA